MTTFNAAAQYRVWYDECKADNINKGDYGATLREDSLVSANDFVVSFTMNNGENDARQALCPARLAVAVVPAATFEQAKRYLKDVGLLACRMDEKSTLQNKRTLVEVFFPPRFYCPKAFCYDGNFSSEAVIAATENTRPKRPSH